MNSDYVSVFRINGVPILPPLMTSEIREKMQQYKEMALYVEEKLNEKQNYKTSVKDTLDTSCDVYNISSSSIESVEQQNTNVSLGSESDYLHVSSIMMDRKRSETPTDIYQKLGITPIKKKSYKDPTSPLLSASSRTFVNSSGMQLSDKEKYDTTFNINDCYSVMSQSVPSTITRTSPLPQTIVRSNSYTMLHPSPVLLKHMEEQGVSYQRPTVSMEELSCGEITQPVDISTNQPSPMLTTSKSSTKVQKSNSMCGVGSKKITAASVIASYRKKSPYDVKLASKTTTAAKPKIKNKTSVKEKVVVKNPNPAQSSLSIVTPTPQPQQNINVLVAKIEEEHRSEIAELMKRQQEEQARMEENFNRQQELLLQKIQESMNIRKSMHVERPSSRIDDKNNNNISNDTIETAIKPVSQCLLEQYLEQAKLPTPPKNHHQQPSRIIQSSNRSISPSTNSSEKSENVLKTPQSCSRRLFPPSAKLLRSSEISLKERKENAATRINALTRGFLVRRLLRTEEVQKIVQVIKDTFHLLLDLLFDEMDALKEDVSNADVELKNRLLHQMRSAQYSLHNCLFNTSIKSRMAMINRDRESRKIRLAKLRQISASNFNDNTAGKYRKQKLEIVTL